jgi:hypothetical protein
VRWFESDEFELNLTDNGESKRYELARKNLLTAILVSVFAIIIVTFAIVAICLW